MWLHCKKILTNQNAPFHINPALGWVFKLSITSRWALMAARGWARLILDRRRDLINDRPNRATKAEAPLEKAQERPRNPTTQPRGACQHGEAA
jgi:hypothetical protein